MNIMSEFVIWHDIKAAIQHEKTVSSVDLPVGWYIGNPAVADLGHFVVGPFENLPDVVSYLDETGKYDGEYIVAKLAKAVMTIKAAPGCMLALSMVLDALHGTEMVPGSDDAVAVAIEPLLHEDTVPAIKVFHAMCEGASYTVVTGDVR